MKFIFHGATKEVGRSCIEAITEDGTRFLFDAGIKLSEHGTEFPERIIDPGSISCVFLSHAHVDHTGYLPVLDHQGMKCPIFATSPTKKIAELLLIDSFKIGRLKHEHLDYEKEDISQALNFMRKVKTSTEGNVGKMKFEYFDAGHIPGAASVRVDVDNKKIVYTGDIKTEETRLHKGADIGYLSEGADVLICEATYGNSDHPPRHQTEKELLNAIEETIERGGSALVPVFAVGRAQEIMMVLNSENLGIPVYLDGMAKEATDMILEYPKSIKDPVALMKAYEKVRCVKGQRQRLNIRKSQGIFVTTSGMLTGGPAMDYLKHMHNEPRNSILLTGYQGEQTNGRMLLGQGQVFIDGWKTNVACNVKQFDFSAHSGQSELKKMIKMANPHTLIFNHGDKAQIEAMKEWAEMMDIDVYAPEFGDRIEA